MVNNILQCISIIVGYAGSLDKNKHRIITYAFVSNILSILMFMATGRKDGIAATIVIAIRCFLFMFKDRYKTSLVLWICIILHIACGVITYNDWLSLIPLVTTVITAIAYWCFDSLKIKYTSIAVNTMWIVYYIYIGLHIIAINSVINMILTVIGIIRIKKDMETYSRG